MTPPADLIRLYLISVNLGANGGTEWPIYISFFPDTPDKAIVIYDTAGIPDGRIMGTGERVEHPGVMIHVRDQSYVLAYTRSRDIALALDGIYNSPIQSGSENWTIINASRTGDIIALGAEPEGRRRQMFSINAVLTIRKNS